MSDPRPPTSLRDLYSRYADSERKIVIVTCDPPEDWGTGENRRYGRMLGGIRLEDTTEPRWLLSAPSPSGWDHTACALTDDGEGEWHGCPLEIPDPEL